MKWINKYMKKCIRLVINKNLYVQPYLIFCWPWVSSQILINNQPDALFHVFIYSFHNTWKSASSWLLTRICTCSLIWYVFHAFMQAVYQLEWCAVLIIFGISVPLEAFRETCLRSIIHLLKDKDGCTYLWYTSDTKRVVITVFHIFLPFLWRRFQFR